MADGGYQEIGLVTVLPRTCLRRRAARLAGDLSTIHHTIRARVEYSLARVRPYNIPRDIRATACGVACRTDLTMVR
jgi:hypothetical protein